MRRLRLSVLPAMVAAVAAAIVLAMGSLGSAPEKAFAAGITSPEGVICFELDNPAGIGLVRIDQDTATDVTLTGQTYIEQTTAVPSCQDPQSPVPIDATPSPDPEDERPSLTGTWTVGTQTISATVCQAPFNFGTASFASAELVINFTLEKPPTKSNGTFSFTGYTNSDCTGTATGPVDVTIQGATYLDGPDDAKTNFDSDWDKDGTRDWDELSPGLPACNDPFKGRNCAIGGIAELAELDGAALEAEGSSGMSAGLIAGLAAGAALGALAFGGAAWYARRRLS